MPLFPRALAGAARPDAGLDAGFDLEVALTFVAGLLLTRAERAGADLVAIRLLDFVRGAFRAPPLLARVSGFAGGVEDFSA